MTPNCLFREFLVLPGDEMLLWQVSPLGGGSGHSMTIDALEMNVWSGTASNCSVTPSPEALSLTFTCTGEKSCYSRNMTCGVEDLSCFFHCEGSQACRYSTFECVHNDSLQCSVECLGCCYTAVCGQTHIRSVMLSPLACCANVSLFV